MKIFLTCFFAVALACGALWRHWRSGTEQLLAATTMPDEASSRDVAEEGPSPEENARRLVTAQRLWEGVAGEANKNAPVTLAHWTALDAVSAADIAAWGRQLKPEGDIQRWGAVMGRWISLDAEAATAHARSVANGETFGWLLTTRLRCDPAGCAGEIKTLRHRDSGHVLVEALAQSDLTAALDVVAATQVDILDKRDAGSNLEENAIAYQDAHPDFIGKQMHDPAREAEFIRWLRNCQDPVAAGRMFATVLTGMNHGDGWLRPERMPDYMPGADQMPKTLEHPDTVWVMGALAGGQDPVSALRAGRGELVNPRGNYTVTERFGMWARSDPESAGLWLNAQPPSPQRDAISHSYCAEVAEEDPEAAVRWAAAIENSSERVRACVSYYPKWHAWEPVQAEAWLAEAGFSETHRLYLAGRAGVWR